MQKRISNEYRECLAYFRWAQYNPITREYLIKNVNEGKRTPKQGYALKCIGLRAGLPDYNLPYATTKYIGLWIEMKTKDQRDQPKRENQDEWIAKLQKIGHYATYAYGCQDAINITLKYLNNEI